jgi:serine/threonine protein kinase/Tfp pilus assembly protein PilF
MPRSVALQRGEHLQDDEHPEVDHLPVSPDGLVSLPPAPSACSLGPSGGPESDLVEAPSFPPIPLRPGEKSIPLDPSTQEAEPAVPRFVAGYEILGLLGQGGMGVVYKARQVGLNRLVALKMIRSPLAGREEQARFHIEAEAVARLQHPNIVQIHEVGQHAGQPFFSLELVEGGSLDTWLRGRPLEPAPAARLLYTLARATQAAHDKGIVHRDLKPANILLGPADPDAPGASATGGGIGGTDLGVPKITDFGLAKCLQEEPAPAHPAGAGAGPATQSGAVLGTPSYMAPEQAGAHARNVGPWTDVYALGAILYELLTGRPPFKGATMLDTLEQVRSQEPVPPRRLQPKVARDLETICLKCLDKQPARRYPRAADLADDLWRYLHSEPIHARPAGWPERVVKWGRRRPTLAALLAASLAVLLALAVAIPLLIFHLRTRVAVAERDGAIANLRANCQLLQREGEEALSRGTSADLLVARARFQNVLEQIEASPSREDAVLAPLRADAERRAAEADRRLDELAAGEEARARYDRFFHLRDEAYFLLHRDLVLGTDSASPEASRQAARAALALFRLDLDGPGPAAAPDLEHCEPARQERLRTGLYEVALLLAEATARSRPPERPPHPQPLSPEGRGENRPPHPQPLYPEAGARGEKQARAALRILDRVAAWAPVTRVGRLRRARYLEMQGDGPAAARERAAAAALAPRTALEWFLSGHDKILVSGDLQAAAADLDAALRIEPDLFWALFLRGLAWHKMNHPVGARVALASCMRERPEFVYSYLIHAMLCLKVGDFDEAAADLARAEAMPLDDAARYVFLVHRGLLARAQGRLADAVNDLRQAVRLEPEQYPAHVDLAQALADRKDLDGAVAALGEALRLEPKQAELYRTRARLYLRRNDNQRHDREAALGDLTEAIRLGQGEEPSPARARDFFERAMLRHRAGQDRPAAGDCEAALELAPDLAPAWRLYGEVLRQLGRPRDALAAFDRYLALDKSPVPDVFRQRARAWAELGEFVRMPAEYTRALALRPDAELYAARGQAYLVNEALLLARHDFEEALKLAPRHAEALVGRGLVRALAGDHRGGAADAEEGLRLGPDSSALLHYGAARVLAQAAVAAAADPRLGARVGEVRRDYEGRGVRQLREAIDCLPASEQVRFWKEKVQRDWVLVPLQRCPEFAAMAEKFSPPGP